MTEQQRIKKTYDAIHKKYPDITDQEKLEELAIKADKRRTVLQAFAWLAGGFVCLGIWLAMMSSGKESLTLIFMLMGGSGLFEFFRTLGKYSGIEKRYRPVANAKFEGILTNERIVKQGGRNLKKADYRYILRKTRLTDKNDELETGSDNETHHTYTLMFEDLPSLNVKRNVYLDAVLDSEYIAVLTVNETGNITNLVHAYPLPNWGLAEELRSAYQGNDFDQINENAKTLRETEASHKPKKTLPIISFVLCGLSLLLPLILVLPLALAAVILSTISFTKSRSKLSTTSMIVSIICLVIVILGFMIL